MTTAFIKVTLFCLILSAFDPVRKLRLLCYGGILVTVVWYFVNLVIIISSCHPRGGHDRIAFLAGMASRKCADTTEIIQICSIATGVFNVIIDLYIMVIPLPAVAKLNMSRKKKIGVAMIFSAGGVYVNHVRTLRCLLIAVQRRSREHRFSGLPIPLAEKP